MATEAQIKANQANAKKSTGPKAEAGREKSSRNRLSHGFYSSSLFIPGENPQDFHNLLADLQAEYHPATATEQMLVEKMVQHQWLSLRAYRLQASALAGSLPAGEIHKDLGVLIRYHHSSDRAFLRMRTELIKAQKQRPDSQIGFEPAEIPEPAPKPAPKPETPPPTIPLTPVSASVEDQLDQLDEIFNSTFPMSNQEMLDYIRNWQKTEKSA